MPRPTWSGFLKLSLVSCPIYLAPATTEGERISFHQLNPATGNRIKLVAQDAETGEELSRSELIKGYEYEKGHYITVTKEELDELQIESSKTLDLTQFVGNDEVTPVYLNTPYYVYPQNEHAEEAFVVIAQAMRKKKKAALGRVVLTSREHPVMVEPFEQGLLMSTLRASNEVRAADFGKDRADADPEMVTLAETIIDRLASKFDPSKFHDRYQDALRELVEAKVQKRPAPKARTFEPASNVIDLMAALRESVGKAVDPPKSAGRKKKSDTRQRAMLLPVKGGAQPKPKAKAETAKPQGARKRAAR